MLYKKTKEEYILTERDQLVLTFQNGELRLLINNTIKVAPQSLNISTEGFEIKSANNGDIKKEITRLSIDCEVEL